jgi:hypothetical protein
MCTIAARKLKAIFHRQARHDINSLVSAGPLTLPQRIESFLCFGRRSYVMAQNARAILNASGIVSHVHDQVDTVFAPGKSDPRRVPPKCWATALLGIRVGTIVGSAHKLWASGLSASPPRPGVKS